MGKEQIHNQAPNRLDITPQSLTSLNPHPAYAHFKQAMQKMGNSRKQSWVGGSEDLIRYLNDGITHLNSMYYAAPVMGGLSMSVAFNCMKDEVRTLRFLEAIEQAVLRRLQFEDEVIVFEAGCGPLAPLSIFAASIDKRVKVHAIEINPYSANLANVTVARLGLKDQVTIHQGDAL